VVRGPFTFGRPENVHLDVRGVRWLLLSRPVWVWISCAVVVVVFAIICAVAALRTWRQVKALRGQLASVQAEVQPYVDRMQVGAPAKSPNVT
jgi:hypothetical protein